MPRQIFQPGAVLTASQVNTFLADQSVMVFSSDAERSTEIPAPIEGMQSYLLSTARNEFYDGAFWVPVYTGNEVQGALVAATFWDPVVDFEKMNLGPAITSGVSGTDWLDLLNEEIVPDRLGMFHVSANCAYQGTTIAARTGIGIFEDDSLTLCVNEIAAPSVGSQITTSGFFVRTDINAPLSVRFIMVDGTPNVTAGTFIVQHIRDL